MSSLTEAMESGDVLAEAERRYRLIASMMEGEPPEGGRGLTGTEMKALSIEADRLIDKIVALRAEQKSDSAKRRADDDRIGKVVQFDASRFRKSG